MSTDHGPRLTVRGNSYSSPLLNHRPCRTKRAPNTVPWRAGDSSSPVVYLGKRSGAIYTSEKFGAVADFLS